MPQGLRGRDAEDLALKYLQKQKLRQVDRNYRCKAGEIDLIMHDGENLIFVEVRHRKQSRYGSAAETVDRKKRSKLLATALYFLQKNPRWQNQPARFDVVAISGELTTPDINWIQNAFGYMGN